MILRNGIADNRINIADRGLQYGDGLFETIAYYDGEAEFVEAHLDRLVAGCERLNIPFQQLEQLRTELTTVYQQLATDNAVIKIIITRGEGGRGYLADSDVEPTRIISTHSYPNYPDSYSQSGVQLRFCQQTLSENKTLAGIKHLNRLEQVLARNEWQDPDIAEGLMCDNHGNIIEGTMSNVFIVKSGQLITPVLTNSGVAGIMRAQIIQLADKQDITVKEREIAKDELAQADELFVCNSVIGIWPVTNIVDTNIKYSIEDVTQMLQQGLEQAKK